MVALTFDDGPDPNVTPRILKALEDAQAKATFFVLGNMTARYPQWVKAAVDQGHVVGSHTWDHAARPVRPRAGRELWRTAEAIHAATGQRPSLFRPPYGIDNGWTARIARFEGYASVLWNKLGPDTVKTPTAEAIAKQVLDTVRPGDIVLFHDGSGHGATASAMPKILSGLKRAGYSFVSTTDLLHKWDSHIVAMEAKAKKQRLAKRSNSGSRTL